MRDLIIYDDAGHEPAVFDDAYAVIRNLFAELAVDGVPDPTQVSDDAELATALDEHLGSASSSTIDDAYETACSAINDVAPDGAIYEPLCDDAGFIYLGAEPEPAHAMSIGEELFHAAYPAEEQPSWQAERTEEALAVLPRYLCLRGYEAQYGSLFDDPVDRIEAALDDRIALRDADDEDAQYVLTPYRNDVYDDRVLTAGVIADLDGLHRSREDRKNAFATVAAVIDRVMSSPDRAAALRVESLDHTIVPEPFYFEE